MVDGSEETEREIRSFGCDGPNHRDEHQCRLRCRSVGYKTGYCSVFTNYKHCFCFQSNSRS